MKLLSIVLSGAALLAACATSDWSRLQAEFAEVSANCRLQGTSIERSRSDRRIIHLVFRQRNAEELASARDGRLACAQHWAQERGFRLTTAPDEGSAN